MKSLIVLWNYVAKDFATRCRISTTNDQKTVKVRSEHEGLSFLTITLPQFGKEFQKALDQGVVAHDMFRSFSKHGRLPRFLGGFAELVFDRDSGTLMDEPDIDAIQAIRQLSLMFSKILIPCSDARERAAMSGFIRCEQEVADHDLSYSPIDLERFKRVSDLLFRSLFSELDKLVYDGDLVPKHGPGATADKLRANAKYDNRVWTHRLEEIFHCGDFLFPSVSHYVEHYDDVHFLEPEAEIPVNVISVPKTQKNPRIIAIEPTHMQYVQQALLEAIVEGLQRNSFLNNLIGFQSQEPNQLLALKGSRNGELATLDLSDASDRVSFKLVSMMLQDHPWLQRAVLACRSYRASVPGHGVIPLSKFASMGSALCFPFEAMVFLTCCFLGIEEELNVSFSQKAQLQEFSESVRIFGDDIIVPVDVVHSVVHQLEHFGARVGASKSFWIGRFRESCGKEYYAGHDVSIVKVRRLLPTTRKHVPEVISMVSLRNQLYKAGCWGATRWLDSLAVRILKYYPTVEESSPVLGRTSFLGYETQKMSEHTHSPLVKGWVVSSRAPKSNLEGPGALLKYFLKRGDLPVADKKHLERAGRPRAVDIRPRWASPF